MVDDLENQGDVTFNTQIIKILALGPSRSPHTLIVNEFATHSIQSEAFFQKF